MRKTKQKQVILNYFKKFPNAHPCADDIYEYIKKEIPTIGIATVYRNLNQLIEQNEIRSLMVDKNCSKYDYLEQEHAHFICDKCEEITNISFNEFTTTQHDIEKKMDCEILEKNIIFRGICSKCK